jgi:DNA polymerase V
VNAPFPTDDTRLLTNAAQEGVERVYREGFRYSKAEVLLLDLSQPNDITGDLFAAAQPVASEKLMGAGCVEWQVG